LSSATQYFRTFQTEERPVTGKLAAISASYWADSLCHRRNAFRADSCVREFHDDSDVIAAATPTSIATDRAT